MALPATDDFTGTNGTGLTTYSANWTYNLGTLVINTNSLTSNSASDCGAHWDADVFGNDQYAQATVVVCGAQGIGLAVRCNTTPSSANYYIYYGNNGSNSGEVAKMVTGSFTGLGAARAAFNASDVLRLEVTGTTISAFRNAVLQGTTQTDSTFISGAAGVSGYSTGANSRIDNWEGGNLGGAAATSTPFARYPMRHMLIR